VLPERYGGAADGSTVNNTAFSNAALVAGQIDAPIGLAGPPHASVSGGNPAVYLLTNGITLNGSGQALAGIGPPVGGAGAQGARIVGLNGRPTLKFSALGANTDCITLGGGQVPQVELRNVQIDANGTGRDGVVILGSNAPIVDNVLIENTARDGLVLSPSGNNWIEKLKAKTLMLRFVGRHGITMSLSGGAGYGAYINECTWEHVELRGCAHLTSGGTFCYMTATAGGDSGAKISNHLWLDPNLDCVYNGTGNVPSISPFLTDSAAVQNFTIIGGGAENTGNISIGAGYSCHVAGSGSWSGLVQIGYLTNSLWGSGVSGVNPDPAITQVFNSDYSLNRTQMMGPASIVLGSDNQTALTLKGQTTSGTQADLQITRTGTASDSLGTNANILLVNTTSNTGAIAQEYNGALIIFTFSGGVWGERARILPGGAIQIGGLSAIYTCSGGPPSPANGNSGDYAFRQDTPSTPNQRIYVKNGTTWTGIV
jgi:hypothetical protein